MNVTKAVKEGYKVLGKPVNHVEIKAKRTDEGGTFYVYDLFDNNNKCMALNRYVFTNNEENRPFAALTKEEEDILNPPIEEPTGELIK